MEKAFKAMGYKTQVKALVDFYDDYGLEGPEEDGAEDEDEDDDEDMSDDDESGEEEGSDSDEDMEG
jgi:hypothetical protein